MHNTNKPHFGHRLEQGQNSVLRPKYVAFHHHNFDPQRQGERAGACRQDVLLINEGDAAEHWNGKNCMIRRTHTFEPEA
jgi:hypothetical protein